MKLQSSDINWGQFVNHGFINRITWFRPRVSPSNYEEITIGVFSFKDTLNTEMSYTYGSTNPPFNSHYINKTIRIINGQLYIDGVYSEPEPEPPEPEPVIVMVSKMILFVSVISMRNRVLS